MRHEWIRIGYTCVNVFRWECSDRRKRRPYIWETITRFKLVTRQTPVGPKLVVHGYDRDGILLRNRHAKKALTRIMEREGWSSWSRGRSSVQKFRLLMAERHLQDKGLMEILKRRKS